MQRIVFAAIVACLTGTAANAGFDQWSTEVEKDPFSNGIRVTVDYSTSIRSGVLLFCDTTENGVSVRAVPGYVHEAAMAGFKPRMDFAVDGKLVGGAVGTVAIVGDSLAAVEVKLQLAQAREFLKAFAAAKRQIAIRDGMSDRPYLLSARGSTKAGTNLFECLKRQPLYVD